MPTVLPLTFHDLPQASQQDLHRASEGLLPREMDCGTRTYLCSYHIIIVDRGMNLCIRACVCTVQKQVHLKTMMRASERIIAISHTIACMFDFDALFHTRRQSRRESPCKSSTSTPCIYLYSMLDRRTGGPSHAVCTVYIMNRIMYATPLQH